MVSKVASDMVVSTGAFLGAVAGSEGGGGAGVAFAGDATGIGLNAAMGVLDGDFGAGGSVVRGTAGASGDGSSSMVISSSAVGGGRFGVLPDAAAGG